MGYWRSRGGEAQALELQIALLAGEAAGKDVLDDGFAELGSIPIR